MSEDNKLLLPKSIKIACYDIKIVDFPHLTAYSSGNYGEFSSIEGAIRVDITQAKYNAISTFLHELNHAIYWAYGIEEEDKEERIVSIFATAMTQILRDNPDVRRFICEAFD